MDEELISSFLFHPRREISGFNPAGIPTVTVSDDAVIAGYLHENAASNTLILYFHGNGEIAADFDTLAPFFTAMDVSLWVVDYRSYGRSTGAPTYSNMLSDALVLFSDIPEIESKIGRQYDHVIVMGRSLGSASAILIASINTSALSGLILDSPFADGLALVRRLGSGVFQSDLEKNFEDNIDLIRHCDLPTLIIHGKEDWIIPVTEAEDLYAASPCEQKILLEIQGAGHNDLLYVGFEEYSSTMRDFIAQIT